MQQKTREYLDWLESLTQAERDELLAKAMRENPLIRDMFEYMAEKLNPENKPDEPATA